MLEHLEHLAQNPKLKTQNSGGALGLYIHVPFCARLCPYCDFAVHPGAAGDFVGEYVAALRRELRVVLREARDVAEEIAPLSSIFVGGGTPTFLGARTLAALLQLVRDEHPLAPDAEISLEANPEDLAGRNAPYDLEGLRGAGFNRLSLGAQSFDDEALRRIGRRHAGAQIEQAFCSARRAGFDNISLDLMFALPGQSREQWRDTLRRALALGPEHLSCYALTIEAGTSFARRVERGMLTPLQDDAQAEMMKDAATMARAGGLNRYEVSNYARPGFECRHNLNYWRGGDYLAAGCGAHGHRNGHRWWNQRDARRYVRAMCETGAARAGEEHLTPRQRLSEIIMLGLRLREGLSLDAVSQRLQIDARRALGGPLQELTRRGVLREAQGVLILDERAVPLADAVAARLMP